MASSCHGCGINFVGLGVRVNGQQILEDINATVPPCSATVIVGPNGAGKTTLLRCLLGEMPHCGELRFVNENGVPMRKPIIGYVPQQLQVDSQLPLRVYEFLTLGHGLRPLWLGCSRKARQDAQALLELVDARKLENRNMGELSGGEMRRVLLAAALGRKPDMLVLDEAEAGVDYRGERLFWQLLDKSRLNLGFTVLMVSHNLPLAAHYATHVLCIKKRLLAEGAPRQTLTGKNLLALFGSPIHLYPNQCDDPGPPCPDCGALGNQPYQDAAPDGQPPWSIQKP